MVAGRLAAEVPSILNAIDRAIRYVFNLACAEKAGHVWQFLQKIAYVIQDATTTFSGVHDFQAFVKSKRLCLRQ